MTDQELVRRIKAGDRGAENELAERFVSIVDCYVKAKLIRRPIRHPDAAEVAQDIADLTIATALERLRNHSEEIQALAPYLLRFADHHLSHWDRARRARRRNLGEVSIEAVFSSSHELESPAEAYEKDQETPSKKVRDRERLVRIHQHLAELPGRSREVFEARLADGKKTFEEIGGQLAMSPRTAQGMIRRGLEKLRPRILREFTTRVVQHLLAQGRS